MYTITSSFVHARHPTHIILVNTHTKIKNPKRA